MLPKPDTIAELPEMPERMEVESVSLPSVSSEILGRLVCGPALPAIAANNDWATASAGMAGSKKTATSGATTGRLPSCASVPSSTA